MTTTLHAWRALDASRVRDVSSLSQGRSVIRQIHALRVANARSVLKMKEVSHRQETGLCVLLVQHDPSRLPVANLALKSVTVSYVAKLNLYEPNRHGAKQEQSVKGTFSAPSSTRRNAITSVTLSGHGEEDCTTHQAN